jgi:hypothetical protein
MPDLLQMTAADVVDWLYKASHDVAVVHAFLDHGITDTDAIDNNSDLGPILDALPAGYPMLAADLQDLRLVGAAGWVGDPENRTDWAAFAAALNEHEARLESEYGYRRPRRAAGSRSYDAHTAIADLLAANRGPSYARALLAAARRHVDEIDAFGYDANPTQYSDLMTAGIRTREALDAYMSTGLTFGRAVEFATRGIPPAAVMQARAEGIDPARWLDALTGLPAKWFVTTDRIHGDEPPWQKWQWFIGSYGRDLGYRLSDLRFMVDHGLDESATLEPPMSRNLRGAGVVANTLALAEHGITWRDADSWVTAMTVGKAPRGEFGASHTVAPLVRWLRPDDYVPVVIALHNTGLRPSHLTIYRQAGCRSPEDVITAVKAGITPAVAKRLLAAHGDKPSEHHSTRLLPNLATLLRLHGQHPETPETTS